MNRVVSLSCVRARFATPRQLYAFRNSSGSTGSGNPFMPPPKIDRVSPHVRSKNYVTAIVLFAFVTGVYYAAIAKIMDKVRFSYIHFFC